MFTFLFYFRIREERLAAYAAKKSKKPALIAKTSVLLDCKPWDDETDMKAMLDAVKAIEMDGLLWGACKFFFKDEEKKTIFIVMSLFQPN